MARGSRRQDWSPREGLPALERYLKAVAVLDAAGSVHLDPDYGPVTVAIVHDGSGYTPGAMVAVGQEHRPIKGDIVDQAHDMMKAKYEEDADYIGELQMEWGDRWEEIMTEAWSGAIWVLPNPRVAARILRKDKRIAEKVEFIEPDAEEG